MKSFSHVQLFVTPWTVTSQTPLSMGFSRQEYWSGLPVPSPGDLPDPGIKPRFPGLQADALTSEPPGKSKKIKKKKKKHHGPFVSVSRMTILLHPARIILLPEGD